MSRRLCCGSHSSITVGHNVLDELVPLIQHHMVDVMIKVALFADVSSLATAVTGLCEGFEGPSAVNICQNAGGKCTQRGVHCCKGRGGGAE
jgi:hypothetical protein